MNGRAVSMFLTLVLKSFKMRKSRYILPTVSLLIGISMITSLVMVSLETEDRIARGLRAFGPNLLVVPRSEDIQLNIGEINLGMITETEYMSEHDAIMIRDLPPEVFGDKVKGVLGKNALLYSMTRVDGSTDIILVGTWFDELESINLWWEISGNYPIDQWSVVLGVDAGYVLGKGIGDKINLDYSGFKLENDTKVPFTSNRDFTISGIVSTGGNDDSRIFGDLDMVQSFTGKEGLVNIMHLSALCNGCPLEDIAEVIENNVESVEVKTVKQVAMAEMDTLNLVQNLVGLITLVSLAASILAVMTTLSLSVVERRKEIGLMKAVGAHNMNISMMFMGEGAIMSIVSGILGFISGIGISQLIGQYVFGTSVGVRYELILLSLFTALGIVFIAAIFPLRMAMKVDPAVVLRGE
ncbi:MAG: ABC transporter permease [Thermoplasmatota archaeon]